jgi:hypothetical protein
MRRLLFLLFVILCAALSAFAQSPSVPQPPPAWRYGLQHWWRAAPGLTGSLKYYNLVTRLNDGILTNMGYSTLSGWSATTRPGGYMQVNFDGTDDYADTSVPAGMTASSPYTLCAWVSPTNSSSVSMILGTAPEGTLGDDFNAYNGIWFLLRSLQVEHNLVLDPDNQRSIRSTASVPLNAWAQVCATHDGTASVTGMGIWINGASAATSTITNLGTVTAITDRPWRIGADRNTTPVDWWSGSLDNLMVWTRALTAAEMADVYQRTLSGQDDPRAVPPLLVAAPAGGAQGSFLPFFQP